MTEMVREEAIDEAAFGVIYEAITVMGVLAATSPDHLDPLLLAGTLFTTVLAVTLAKAYAELASSVLKSHQPANRSLIAASWQHSATILLAANVPTLVMLLGAAGIYNAGKAFMLSQIAAILLLVFYGARIGFRLYRRFLPAVIGGVFMGAIGLSLALLKNLFH